MECVPAHDSRKLPMTVVARRDSLPAHLILPQRRRCAGAVADHRIQCRQAAWVRPNQRVRCQPCVFRMAADG